MEWLTEFIGGAVAFVTFAVAFIRWQNKRAKRTRKPLEDELCLQRSVIRELEAKIQMLEKTKEKRDEAADEVDAE